MIGRLRALLAIPLVLPACATLSQETTEQLASANSTEAEIRRAERAWLDAYETRNVTAMEAVLAEEFLITYPNGRTMTRADVLSQLQRLPPRAGTRFETEGTTIVPLGNVAVITGRLRMSSGQGIRRNRYTDTWVRRGPGWQVVASHLSEDSDQ